MKFAFSSVSTCWSHCASVLNHPGVTSISFPPSDAAVACTNEILRYNPTRQNNEQVSKTSPHTIFIKVRSLFDMTVDKASLSSPDAARMLTIWTRVYHRRSGHGCTLCVRSYLRSSSSPTVLPYSSSSSCPSSSYSSSSRFV